MKKRIKKRMSENAIMFMLLWDGLCIVCVAFGAVFKLLGVV